jgi:hypothetical protein
MATTKYSDATKQHFANLKDYLESQIYEMDYSNKFGNLRTTFLSVEETPTGSRTIIDFIFSKNPTLSLTRMVRGTEVEWSVRESFFLGLSNIVSHDEFLENLITKLLISMIKDRPNRSRLCLDHTSTKLKR